jgi:hypothetical protein
MLPALCCAGCSCQGAAPGVQQGRLAQPLLCRVRKEAAMKRRTKGRITVKHRPRAGFRAVSGTQACTAVGATALNHKL